MDGRSFPGFLKAITFFIFFIAFLSHGVILGGVGRDESSLYIYILNNDLDFFL
jgi:hypothetical protein